MTHHSVFSNQRFRNRAQLYSLFALIVYTPLPLASDRPWALALLGLLTGGLLIWTLWQPRGRTSADIWQLAKLPLLFLGLWISLLIMQLVPFNEAFRHQASIGSFSGAGALTIDSYSTRLYLAESCILSAILWLVFRLVNSHRRFMMLVKTIILSGLLQAMTGVMMMSAGMHFQLFFVPLNDVRAHGSFVSPNNFAGYLELTLAAGIGLMIAKLDGRSAANWRRRLHGWVALILSEKAMLRLSLIIMVVGLVASRSRMGNSAFFASLLIVGIFTVMLTKYMTRAAHDERAIDTTRSMIVFITSLIVLDIVIIGGVVGVEKVIDRIEYTNLRNQEVGLAAAVGPDIKLEAVKAPGQVALPVKSLHPQEESVEHRSEVARASIPVIRDYPVLGTGGGTFHLAFPRYKPAEVTGYWDHVHNDYIEIASDTGLTGLLILGLLVLHSMARSVGLLARSEDQMVRGMAFASLMGIVSLLIHAAVDFNFQNPANAMLFMIMLCFPYLMSRRAGKHADL